MNKKFRKWVTKSKDTRSCVIFRPNGPCYSKRDPLFLRRPAPFSSMRKKSISKDWSKLRKFSLVKIIWKYELNLSSNLSRLAVKLGTIWHLQDHPKVFVNLGGKNPYLSCPQEVPRSIFRNFLCMKEWRSNLMLSNSKSKNS